MEFALIPFVVSFLTVPFVYKYLTPKLTGGKVALKPGSWLRFALFGLCMSIVFCLVFLSLYVGVALAMTPFVKDLVNPASDVTMDLVRGCIRALLAQSVFFVLTLIVGRFCKKTLLVEGTFNAWKASWAPAFVTALFMWLVSLLVMRFVYPQ